MAGNEITLGGNVFYVSPMLGEASFLMVPRLAPVMAEIAQLWALFGKMVYKASDSGKNDDVDVAELLPTLLAELEPASAIIARLCAKLPQDELRAITRQLLAGATVDGLACYTGEGNPIDVKLRGRALDFWRLVIHAVEVSFPDFFAVARGLRARPLAAAPSATSGTSAPTPAGGS